MRPNMPTRYQRPSSRRTSWNTIGIAALLISTQISPATASRIPRAAANSATGAHTPAGSNLPSTNFVNGDLAEIDSKNECTTELPGMGDMASLNDTTPTPTPTQVPDLFAAAQEDANGDNQPTNDTDSDKLTAARNTIIKLRLELNQCARKSLPQNDNALQATQKERDNTKAVLKQCDETLKTLSEKVNGRSSHADKLCYTVCGKCAILPSGMQVCEGP